MNAPSTIATALLAFSLCACGGQKKSGLSVTAAGTLGHFDFEALSPGQPMPAGDDVTKVLRCSFIWQDEPDEGFVVDIATTNRTAADGVSLVGVRMDTVKSSCELVGLLTGPAKYYEVAGEPEARATVRIAYTCPSGEGGGGIMLSTVNPPEVVFSGMTCSPAKSR
ncbi:MAG: hypothetical protein ACI9MR_001580 [Myxococcota bacterium]|jgi:hypothetical protein